LTSRKSQNSILFLTTLGVYLGLVLVGATPQVLAQAATAKQFSVKDEIEVKDKLDNDPDDCARLAEKLKEKQRFYPIDDSAFARYTISFADIALALKQYWSRGLMFSAESYGDSIPHDGVFTAIETGKPILFSAKVRRKLDEDVLTLSRAFPSTNGSSQKSFEFELSLTDSGLVTTAKFLRHDDTEAHQAFIAYDSGLDLWRCTAKSEPERMIAQNTEVSRRNSQILIVTLLPRAGLDSLLALNAK
jgi:hypothetical protein